MTPAELKTIREACGLTLPDLAAMAGVQERTARYWESGKSAVPADVEELINRLDISLTLAANQAVHLIAEHARKNPDAQIDVVLIRYKTDDDLHRYRPDMQDLPATAHAAIIYRTRATLANADIPSRIIYMEPDAYSAWLGKRKDNEATRSAWAASLAEIKT